MRNKDSVVLGLGGAECGDIIFTINEGFNRLHGDGLSTAEGYAQTSVTPVFLAAGEDIKEGKITDRVIRQVDVAPTIAEILDVRKPEQCEGPGLSDTEEIKDPEKFSFLALDKRQKLVR